MPPHISWTDIATFVLVIVTFFYAIQTYRMVKEMEAGRKLSAMPFIVCSLVPTVSKQSIFIGSNEPFSGEWSSLHITNHGNSPALNTRFNIKCTSADNGWLTFGPVTAQINSIIVSGGSITSDLGKATLVADYQKASNSAVSQVTIDYTNIYGVPFRTEALFEWPVPNEQDNWIIMEAPQVRIIRS